MNKIILFGRLVRDPEVRVTPSEKTVCTFTLAVDRQFPNQSGEREADFINIVVWGKVAELFGNSLAKGQRLLVDGRLQIRNYVSKDGNKRYITEVIANSVKFIERKSTGSVGSNADGGQEHTVSKSGMEGFGQAVAFDEEIPF
jgi:single-strand DNA-binding protein